MSSDNTQLLARSARAFLSGTFLSRLTGMGRDIAMAFCFGSHPAIAAFMVAFRFANLSRRLFGEGALASSFIPVFEKARAQDSLQGARLYRDLFFSLIVFLCLILLGIEAVLWFFRSHEIVALTMWMLPGVLFICLYGLGSALLQCEKKFFLPSVAPVAFNLIWIGSALLLRKQTPPFAVVGLSLAVVVAFCFQWLLTVPSSLSVLKLAMPHKMTFSPELRLFVKNFLLGILGIGAVQINSALDGIFARFADLEGPAYLWYAIRIEQLPLALFGIALASALLPPLSRASSPEQARFLLTYALTRGYQLIFPCTLALFVLGACGVNLLYGRGGFTQAATHETLLCLWGYGIGLLPSVFVLIVAPAFYARQDYKTPTKASVFSVLINTFLNAFMVFVLHWGALSIALATSLAALFNAAYLMKKLGGPFVEKKPCLKVSAYALLAATLALVCGRFFFADPTLGIWLGKEAVFARTFFAQLIHCFGLMGVFALPFVLYFKIK